MENKNKLRNWIFYLFSTSFILLISAFIFGGLYYYNINNMFFYWLYNFSIGIATLFYFVAGLLLIIYGITLWIEKVQSRY